MPDTKISGDPVAAPLTGSELVPLVQSASNVRSTVDDVRNGAGAPLTFALQNGVQVSPGVGKAKIFTRNKAGRATLEIQGGNVGEKDTAFQPALFGNKIHELWPTSSTTLTGRGNVWTSVGGTVSTPTPSAVQLEPSMSRIRFTTATTANSISGVNPGIPAFHRGATAPIGGFFMFIRFSLFANASGTRFFAGMSATTPAAVTSEISTMTHMIGVGFDSTDLLANPMSIMMNDASGTATKISIPGADRVSLRIYDLTIWCAPSSNSMTVRLFDQNNQIAVLDNVSYTTDLPGNTQGLGPRIYINNTSTAAAASVDVAHIYCEADL